MKKSLEKKLEEERNFLHAATCHREYIEQQIESTKENIKKLEKQIAEFITIK